jgi:chromosomal replication initiation ATPase DnaA
MTEFEWEGGLSAFYRKRIVAAAREVAANSCGVDEGEVRANLRKWEVAFARQLAMYLCHVTANMSLREISGAFRRDRTTVSHACHAIEDRRDCPTFDRQIELLEKEFRGRIRAIVESATRAGPPIERKQLRQAG